ncbi:Huntingtin-interacting protein 1 [Trichoplax sp. H2]|nr:Huntingtin-interacting protein 1 [Trichoplax sp. H2]|eukprot:RDD41002.1 Huntingtin-interacting protein 1 [Trichoplax sp. H2]
MVDSNYRNIPLKQTSKRRNISRRLSARSMDLSRLNMFDISSSILQNMSTVQYLTSKMKIICWKGLCIIHKIFIEGHPNVIIESYNYKNLLSSLLSTWTARSESYPKLIILYLKYLDEKLEFHKKYQAIPSNFTSQSSGSIIDLPTKDMNDTYQLVVDLLDLQDQLLRLQYYVYEAVGLSGSMNPSGQCKVFCFITIIHESYNIYGLIVKAMFELHKYLDPEFLAGHRTRFSKQLAVLRTFYNNAHTLTYLRTLTPIPTLPENEIEFVQGDVSNVVITSYRESRSDFSHDSLPSPDASPSPDLISDLDATDRSSASLSSPISPAATIEHSFADIPETVDMQNVSSPRVDDSKDELINHLRQRIEELQIELVKCKSEFESEKSRMHEQILEYEEEIQQLKTTIKAIQQELAEYRAIAEESCQENVQLKAHLDTLAIASPQVAGGEWEAKFNKMKQMYLKVRDDHVNLLRKHGNIESQLKAALLENGDILVELESKTADNDNLSQELSALVVKLDLLNKQHEQELRQKNNKLQDQTKQLESVHAEMEALKASTETITVKASALTDAVDERLLQSSNEENVPTSDSDKNEFQFSMIDWSLQQAIAMISLSLDGKNPSALPVDESLDSMLFLAENSSQRATMLTVDLREYFKNNSDIESIDTSLRHFISVFALMIYTSKISFHGDENQKTNEIIEKCENAGYSVRKFLEDLRSTIKDDPSMLEAVSEDIKHTLDAIIDLVKKQCESANAVEKGDIVGEEMAYTTEAIDVATAKIEALLRRARENETGTKLEVNERILDSSTKLMNAIRLLIIRASILQKEIVRIKKGISSGKKDFYKRNNRWTEGLLSAAKAVGASASNFVEVANEMMEDTCGLEELVVASREISSSTVQLVTASRVKSNPRSENLLQLESASKLVTASTTEVIAAANAGRKILAEDDQNYDFSKISLTQAKRLEMESQVRLLRLESNVTKERGYLGRIRKHHYHLAGASEGWEVDEAEEANEASENPDEGDKEIINKETDNPE